MRAVVVMLALWAALCGSAYTAPSSDSTMDARLEALLLQHQQQDHIPGLVLAVVQNDRVIYIRALGYRDVDKRLPVTIDTVFPIGSCTKSFTAAAIGLNDDSGRLKLDDHPSKFLPYFHLADPTANSEVTFEDMLSHRTGLMANNDLSAEPGVLTREEYIRAATSAVPTAPFRTTFQYNNAMFAAAGTALGAANGTTWERVIEQQLFAPLGMVSSTANVFEIGQLADHAVGYRFDTGTRAFRRVPVPNTLHALAPAGAIASNARDMTKWVAMWADGGIENGRRFLSRPVFERLTAPHMRVTPHVQYALGWATYDWRGEKVIEHNGGSEGISALVSFMPSRKLGIVFLANTDPNPMTFVGRGSAWVYDAIYGLSPAPPTNAPTATPTPQPTPSAGESLPSTALVIQHIVSAAGETSAIKRHASWRLSADKAYVNEGVSGPLSIWARMPAMRAEEETWFAAGRRIAHVRSYFDGVHGGQETTFGQNGEYSPQENADAFRDDLMHPLLAWRTYYSGVQVAGTRTIAGEPAYILKMTPYIGGQFELAVSSRSWHILQRRTESELREYSDYRNVDGESVPFTVIVHDALGESTIHVRRITFNVGISPNRFRRRTSMLP